MVLAPSRSSFWVARGFHSEIPLHCPPEPSRVCSRPSLLERRLEIFLQLMPERCSNLANCGVALDASTARPVRQTAKVSDYAQLMRTWLGFETREALTDHVIRYLPRDFELFARLNPGDQYPEAWRHANIMLGEQITILRRKGVVVREDTAEYRRLRDAIVPRMMRASSRTSGAKCGVTSLPER